MRRRTFAGVLGSIAAGTAGYGLLTQESEAASVAVDRYHVANRSVETPTSVNGVTLDVNGSWSYSTTAAPTRVTLRLTVTYATETHQVGAMSVPGELTPSDSGEFDLSANLLDHPRITAPSLTPTEVGETKSLTFDTALTLTVTGESGGLGSQTVADTATIEVTRQQASVETSLSADGTISISTKTPA